MEINFRFYADFSQSRNHRPPSPPKKKRTQKRKILLKDHPHMLEFSFGAVFCKLIKKCAKIKSFIYLYIVYFFYIYPTHLHKSRRIEIV